MRILSTGNGEREKQFRALCLASGHQLPDHGPWDAAVLPLPRSDISEDTADQLPRGQKVICGRTDDPFDRLAKRRGWKLCRVLEDETYLLENAALTSEGAVFAAMEESRFSLMGARCLVAGYGRIGKELTRRLRALDALVTVAARRPESRSEAGEGSVSIEEIPRVIGEMDLIFNTVPAPVIGWEALCCVRPGALLIELASPPYGIDQEAANALGLRCRLESGLPGRYCPLSAAKALLDYLNREVSI